MKRDPPSILPPAGPKTALGERVAEIAMEEILATSAERRKQGQFARGALLALGKEGLLAPRLTRARGGRNLTTYEWWELVRTLVRVGEDAGTGWMVALQGLALDCINQLPGDVPLPWRDCARGRRLVALALHDQSPTTLRPVGAELRLAGSKRDVVGGGCAKLFLVSATEGEQVALVAVPATAVQIRPDRPRRVAPTSPRPAIHMDGLSLEPEQPRLSGPDLQQALLLRAGACRLVVCLGIFDALAARLSAGYSRFPGNRTDELLGRFGACIAAQQALLGQLAASLPEDIRCLPDASLLIGAQEIAMRARELLPELIKLSGATEDGLRHVIQDLGLVGFSNAEIERRLGADSRASQRTAQE